MRASYTQGAAAAAVSLLATRALAQDDAPPTDDAVTAENVADMSLEELMSLRVSTVAGVESNWFTTPSAIAVITADDVRRSGARTLADALRLAPGVFVGRTTSSSYSIGMRGFNGSLANKTLVLIDGRAVYDPLFGGTFWDVQDTVLEDLDRIEVIRGPGATLWGANAVNGVINVITRSAKDTQGALLGAGVGTYERGFGEVRYGFEVGEHAWMRVFGKWLERDAFTDIESEGTHDDWAMARGGFRFDAEPSDGVTLTLQGDAYHTDRIGEFTPSYPVPGQSLVFASDVRDQRRTGGNVLARLSREEKSSGWALQAYYDRTEREYGLGFELARDTFDLDWRHHFEAGNRNEVVWGLGARYWKDRTRDGAFLLMDPDDSDFTQVGGFIQDTITLVPDRLFAMVGTKVSLNDYTGLEVQPGARLWWTPDERNTLWASISRPVRLPSRTEEHGTLVFVYIDQGVLAGGPPTGVIVPLGLQPNDDLEAEELLAYEAGYRVRPHEQVTIDTSVYFNDYDRLIYVPNGISAFDNNSAAESYGGEVALSWRVRDEWSLAASYSLAKVQVHGSAVPADEGNTPLQMAQLRSSVDLTEKLEWNAGLYYVDRVRQADVDPYMRLDVGLTWRFHPGWELSVWGQNLLDPAHREFSANEVPRGVYVMCTARF